MLSTILASQQGAYDKTGVGYNPLLTAKHKNIFTKQMTKNENRRPSYSRKHNLHKNDLVYNRFVKPSMHVKCLTCNRCDHFEDYVYCPYRYKLNRNELVWVSNSRDTSPQGPKSGLGYQ